VNRKIDIRTERRKYTRLAAPVDVSYVLSGKERIRKSVTRDISAQGISFEAEDDGINIDSVLDMSISLPGTPNPVHAKGIVIWKERVSLRDGSPIKVGLELAELEEDNKNTFLKFMCDLLYATAKEGR
jgi:c-di-GMP-binding flagellar brake protein YcgR